MLISMKKPLLSLRLFHPSGHSHQGRQCLPIGTTEALSHPGRCSDTEVPPHPLSWATPSPPHARGVAASLMQSQPLGAMETCIHLEHIPIELPPTPVFSPVLTLCFDGSKNFF